MAILGRIPTVPMIRFPNVTDRTPEFKRAQIPNEFTIKQFYLKHHKNHIRFMSQKEAETIQTDTGQLPPTANYLLQCTHNAYHFNLGLILNPEIFWFMIMNDFSINKYKKITEFNPIHNSNYPFEIAYSNLIENKIVNIKNKLPKKIQNFYIPSFIQANTTKEFCLLSTIDNETTPLITFEDTNLDLIHFGSISKIKIEGSIDEWQNLLENVQRLKNTSNKDNPYNKIVEHIESILSTIRRTHIDTDFWKNIYKIRQGKFEGWIFDFMQFQQTNTSYQKLNLDNLKPKNIPSYLNLYENKQNKNIFLLSGLMNMNYDDGFFKPELGLSVITT